MIAIAVSAILVVVARFASITRYHRPGARWTIDELRAWERRYALGNYLSALLLAVFSVRVLSAHVPLQQLIAVSLIFSFGAGIVSRISIRPRICVISLLIATVPTVIALATHATSKHDTPLHAELFAIEALLVAMITALSLDTVRHLHRSTVEHLTIKHDLAQLATQDALTGLPNRLMLRERFNESILPVSRSSGQLALHFLDLDGFKAINDIYGHPAGDAVLKQVSARLTAMVRESDTVARMGGDEFVVVQGDIKDGSEADLLARRIIRRLSAPYVVDGQEMHISVSVGIAMAPEQGLDLEHLASCADSALYRAKRGGKAQLHFCTPDEALAIRSG
ncbi:GGDEF domain-containing protein [Sphingomonas colocasiae]|uniref:GGDEF domain-containing protein n=2 Tax=Sphingomonas colocasiae TaxID=1848973 RepID=A0ABS7PZ22_9SPHN|nr:GGDEF domain-containing protein [Sphingomonas colocasiae]